MTNCISKINSLTPEQAAWLAGIYQSEAYFYLDKRRRSKSGDPNYTPPPPTPSIKLEMIEKDLMTHIGNFLNKNVIEVKRKTSAGNQVYKVLITAREEVKAFLLKIQPYIIGNKTQLKITELLNACYQYDVWVAAGGHTKAAQLANKASQKSRKK